MMVDDALGRRPHRRWLIILLALVVLAAGFGALAYVKLIREQIPAYASDEQHFKYGSIGNDGNDGIPYAIWAVLPKAFPEYLPGPGGYSSLGFRWERGHEPPQAPVGFSKARVGIDRIAINCAVCHTTTYRVRPGEPLQFAPGGVSNAVDVLGYQRFLTASARDARFTPKVLLPAMERAGIHLSWLDRQLYRYLLIPLTRSALRKQGERFAWTDTRPSWGPGRIDPFNPVKFGILKLPIDDTIGNSDMQAVWGLGRRKALRPEGALHWDGLNDNIREVVLSSALGDGSPAGRYAKWQESADRIERYLRQLRPPSSPYRPNPAAVARGTAQFAAHCASCHAPRGPRTFAVIPIGELATDPQRLGMWSAKAAATYNAYGHDAGFSFRRFRKINGYVAETLDGLWLRAPYLHNGSVPTLRDLLEPPERRPKAFVRGLELLDSARGGFQAPPCQPMTRQPGRFCYDTALPGNGNGGHLYGTNLNGSEKDDLVAYLLSL